MTDRKALVDSADTPEDVATLYSWANLHGAKYRDFSASRAQTREKARQRVQEAIEAEKRRSREEVEARKTADTQQAAEAARVAEAERKAEEAARANAKRAEQLAAQQRAYQPQRPERAAPPALPPAPDSQAPQAYYPPAATPAYLQQPPYSQPPAFSQANYPEPAAYPPSPAFNQSQPQAFNQLPSPAFNQPHSYAQPRPVTPPARQPALAPMREENYPQGRDMWVPADSRDNSNRPAWLNADRSETAPQSILHAPEDTLQGSRDRLTSRWFALKGIFNGAGPVTEPVPPPPSSTRAPVLAVFSLAGGVGKTSLVATLGRALSARGERVLLVDTAAYGLLPFFFGARDQRPGALRTFSPPGGSGDAPIQMVTIDPETLGPEAAQHETLSQEISRHGRIAGRVIVDLATASGATTRRVLRMAPTILVPVRPDMSSVVSVGSIDSFFQHNTSGSGQKILPYYVLNQFDPSLPLHLDVREVLREQLGDRLLPFVLRRTPAVSEALAEGMTVVDYAPNSSAAEDFGSLAGWVKNMAAPATQGYRGVRWSER